MLNNHIKGSCIHNNPLHSMYEVPNCMLPIVGHLNQVRFMKENDELVFVRELLSKSVYESIDHM